MNIAWVVLCCLLLAPSNSNANYSCDEESAWILAAMRVLASPPLRLNYKQVHLVTADLTDVEWYQAANLSTQIHSVHWLALCRKISMSLLTT